MQRSGVGVAAEWNRSGRMVRVPNQAGILLPSMLIAAWQPARCALAHTAFAPCSCCRSPPAHGAAPPPPPAPAPPPPCCCRRRRMGDALEGRPHELHLQGPRAPRLGRPAGIPGRGAVRWVGGLCRWCGEHGAGGLQGAPRRSCPPPAACRVVSMPRRFLPVHKHTHIHSPPSHPHTTTPCPLPACPCLPPCAARGQVLGVCLQQGQARVHPAAVAHAGPAGGAHPRAG